ncbi:MAG: ACP S-malonyltransferase [Actinobacteria bacterium]|nr:ACP S-malonyltransferase [Actinomycetota bacterium]NCW23009.1 ACP S-malonyltransferase [Actinomycetota bacterium]
MLIIACPGQGSQTPGFLSPWLEVYPQLEATLTSLGEACGADLVRLGTTAEEEEIKDTANAQRLIVGSALAVYRTVFESKKVDGVLGHSVGEFAAAAIAGVIGDNDAMQLVAKRADAMAEAAAKTPTSMAAVLGGEEADVLKAIGQLELEPANFNGSGQIVAAGAKAAIQRLVESPPEKARVIELKVAGAFHTSFMESAKKPVAEVAEGFSAKDPEIKLWSNVDGAQVQDGTAFLSSLVSQIASPVRWDKCMTSLSGLSATVVELPPAGALAGLTKRGVLDATAIALKTPADVEKVPNS